MLTGVLLGVSSHADTIPYTVATTPWETGMGDHRAVIHVQQNADAVLVNLPWRRRDHDPDKKQVIVVDAATGKRVANVARFSVTREAGQFAFEPQTVPGDYCFYYLPYTPQGGWGGYGGNYLPPQETADATWRQRLPQDTAALPQAKVLRFEARSEFDNVYPMEVIATAAETKQLLEKHPQPYLVFPEDRRFPIRMLDDLPHRWITEGPGTEFHGEAQRNEYYALGRQTVS